jgi:hypothetical protein
MVRLRLHAHAGAKSPWGWHWAALPLQTWIDSADSADYNVTNEE